MINDMRLLPSYADIYDEFKTKEKDALLVSSYYQYFMLTLIEMFEYQNLPDTMNRRYIETCLLQKGLVFIWKNKDGDLISSFGTLAGELDSYGIGTQCVATTLNGETKEGKRDSDIVVGFNNDLFTSENNFIVWLDHIMSEIDISLDHLIKYTRLLPVPIVKDEKTKRAFDECIDNLLRGKMTAVLSDNVLNNETGIEEQVLEITDPNHIDKVQHLSRLYDDIVKRFYNRYGQALQTQNKTAQTTNDELHGMDSVSFIIPLNMLKCRQEMVSKINEVFGTDITVTFSDTWKQEFTNYKNDMSEPNETQTEPVETQTEPTETLSEPTETMSDSNGTDDGIPAEGVSDVGDGGDAGDVGDVGDAGDAGDVGDAGDAGDVGDVDVVVDVDVVYNKEETEQEVAKNVET